MLKNVSQIMIKSNYYKIVQLTTLYLAFILIYMIRFVSYIYLI